jgi:hypothetical protein
MWIEGVNYEYWWHDRDREPSSVKSRSTSKYKWSSPAEDLVAFQDGEVRLQDRLCTSVRG